MKDINVLAAGPWTHESIEEVSTSTAAMFIGQVQVSSLLAPTIHVGQPRHRIAEKNYLRAIRPRRTTSNDSPA
jgi:hypothetical protein